MLEGGAVQTVTAAQITYHYVCPDCGYTDNSLGGGGVHLCSALLYKSLIQFLQSHPEDAAKLREALKGAE